MTTALAQAIETLGLSIRSEFVPFSQSRNKAEKNRSLNWRVTLMRRTLNANGDARYTDVLTTDYSAGIAHCPSYKLPVKDAGHINSVMRANMIETETETGRTALPHRSWQQGKPILPDPIDVIYSLVMDASVLDAGTFENWASEYGYDTDSRSAEATYRACLDIALQLRAGIGETMLQTLQTAAQEY